MLIDLETGDIYSDKITFKRPDGSKANVGEAIKEVEDKIPAIWEVQIINLNEGAPMYVDERATNPKLRAVSLTVRYLRNREDVSVVMAKSQRRLYEWGRKSPLGYDDKGVTDEEWSEANARRDVVTLVSDDVMWVANVYTEFDPQVLEQEYMNLK